MNFSFEHAWAALLTLVMTLLGFREARQREELKAMKDGISEAKKNAAEAGDALDAHKLFAAENFAKKSDLKDMEDRITQAMKNQAQDTNALLRDIRDRMAPPRSN